MAPITDGYYFMFEIGWFLDLMIPTLVRVQDGLICLVGSKPCDAKNLKPCCVPCGGEAEVKKLSPQEPALKAFKSGDSLVPIEDPHNLEGELDKCLGNQELRGKYMNTTAKAQREAMIERVMSDYQVLSGAQC